MNSLAVREQNLNNDLPHDVPTNNLIPDQQPGNTEKIRMFFLSQPKNKILAISFVDGNSQL